VGARPLTVPTPTATPAAAPSWPSADLEADVRQLLLQYYQQRAVPNTPENLLAPRTEADKAAAAKDPDSLWQQLARANPADPQWTCHGATTENELLRCTGFRLAKTLPWSFAPYSPPLAANLDRQALSLFSSQADFYRHHLRVMIAGYYAFYHAFVHDFELLQNGEYIGVPGADPRQYKRYHERMIRAYEWHMRDLLERMFRDTRTNGQFQADLTRTAGDLEWLYVAVVSALEEYGAWASPADRRNAISLVNGLSQRVWWEWVWPQRDGPRTAGLANLGSEQTYQTAMTDPALRATLLGTNQFVIDGLPVFSLRPAALDIGSNDGLWFDADFAMPGEWFCFATYETQAIVDLRACLTQAARQAKDGLKSPFGEYYGREGIASPCSQRAGVKTAQSCGVTNLGSIAEEWTWSFLGARAGTDLIRRLQARGDPHVPAGALGGNPVAFAPGQTASVVQIITDRLGYGISGWHGGEGRQDDLEWPWHQAGGPRAIRTLSAGRHDFETQNGRFSLGEEDIWQGAGSSFTGRKGDMWAIDGQEAPGAIENHAPGPSPNYGTSLLAFATTDKAGGGLSGSLFNATFRDEPDEFNSWVWLMLSSYYRCRGVDDPADPRCFAFSAAQLPANASIQRVPLFSRPDDASISLPFRYLWRDTSRALDSNYIASRTSSCQTGGGLPWRHANDRITDGESGYLVDELQFGAYNQLLQGLAGFMRVAAARHAVPAPNANLASAYQQQRRDVLAPWYTEAHDLAKGILALYRRAPPNGFGYVPDIENSTCIGADPSVVGGKAVQSVRVATNSQNDGVHVRRAMLYSAMTIIYWRYDDRWLDVDAAVWGN
jgi:hypothetical protein